MTFPSVPEGGRSEKERVLWGGAAFRGTGSRALEHHLHIPAPLSNLEPWLTAGASRALVVRQLQPPCAPLAAHQQRRP